MITCDQCNHHPATFITINCITHQHALICDQCDYFTYHCNQCQEDHTHIHTGPPAACGTCGSAALLQLSQGLGHIYDLPIKAFNADRSHWIAHLLDKTWFNLDTFTDRILDRLTRDGLPPA